MRIGCHEYWTLRLGLAEAALDTLAIFLLKAGFVFGHFAGDFLFVGVVLLGEEVLAHAGSSRARLR